MLGFSRTERMRRLGPVHMIAVEISGAQKREFSQSTDTKPCCTNAKGPQMSCTISHLLYVLAQTFGLVSTGLQD